MTKGHIMSQVYPTLADLELSIPEIPSDWLVAGSFRRVLPDRINSGTLGGMLLSKFGPEKVRALQLGEGDDGIVQALLIVIAPDPEVVAFTQEQTDIIARDGIHDDEIYWSMVDPLIAAVWASADRDERVRLCQQVGIDVSHADSDDMPEEAHAQIYHDISV